MKFIFTLVTALAVWNANAQCWQTLSAGSGHSVVIQTDGTAWSWGSNFSGQLGDGTNTNRNYPAMVGEENNWKSMSYGCNYTNTVAIKSDGSLWRWASNDGGETISQTGTDNNWAFVASGTGYYAALKTDGTLWTWGNNMYGCLGNGTDSSNFTPTQLGTDTWISTAAGTSHTLGIKSDGTLWAWGHNFYGQLGDGSNTDRFVPVQVGSASNWEQVIAGGYFSVAKKTDGSIWSWGINSEGQLGNSSLPMNNVPAKIGLDNNWASISAGYNLVGAIKTDGSLWTWGDNSWGQLGIANNYPTVPFPYRVGTQNDWQAIDHGNAHTLALKTDGTLWAWGHNNLGQLGDNTNINRNYPVPVLCLPLGTQSHTGEASFKLYPNPVQRTLYFGKENYSIDGITVTDISGQTLLSKQGNMDELDVSEFAAGIYFLKVTASGKTSVQKFIKN